MAEAHGHIDPAGARILPVSSGSGDLFDRREEGCVKVVLLPR